MATFLSLLLLLTCSVSAAQFTTGSDNEVTSHLLRTESKGEEVAKSSNNQQSCTTDIHAVLREMTATLAGLKYEVRDLQRENEVQTAKVRHLELQIIEMEKLKAQQQAHAGELVTIKARANVTENHVDALRREGEGKKVAFSASLLASGDGTLGPFNAFTLLVFRHVVTNIGNAYNPNTGFFTAPVRGAFHFEMHIYGNGHPSHPTAAVLVKNGQNVFIAYAHQSGYSLKASNSVTLFLEVGDIVFLNLWSNSRVYDSQNRHTTFSGHLLFMI